jgi:hypothetical protein
MTDTRQNSRSLGPVITATNSPYLSLSNFGTGNVLFQIASCLGLCKIFDLPFNRVGLDLYLKKIKELDPNSLQHRLYRRVKDKPLYTTNLHIVKEKEGINKKIDANLIESIAAIKDVNALVYGYLESPTYFRSMYDEIRTLFRPSYDDYSLIVDRYPTFMPTRTIGIHLRRAKDTIMNTDNTYYLNALRKAYETIHWQPEQVLIFSDINITPSDLTIFESYRDKLKFVVGNPDWFDLWMFSLCRVKIISQSTFSWWGAYISEREEDLIIYPKSALEFYGCNEVYGNGLSESINRNVYFQDWTCIE